MKTASWLAVCSLPLPPTTNAIDDIVGWSRVYESYPDTSAFKRNVIHLITSMRTVLRSLSTSTLVSLLTSHVVPLILVNIFIIVYELFLG